MSFDPLSFFEPISSEDTESTILINSATEIRDSDTGDHEDRDNDNAGTTHSYIPIQVLDLPQINENVSYPILCTILNLFKPDQLKNFGKNTPEVPSLYNEEQLVEYLQHKSVTRPQLDALATFLGYDVPSVLTITQLPTLASSETTSYITKVISHPFIKYTEEERDNIYDLASHVMTANSAPALKGNTTRLVEIDHLEKEILLYEPALTEDKVGNLTWGASLELAKVVVNSDTSLWLGKPNRQETPILELGAGTGLVTIVLGLLNHRVVSTDLPEIIDNLEKNINLNKLECIKTKNTETTENTSLIHVTSLDWRAPNEFLARTATPDGYPVVILSDPVYSPQHPYWVQDTVRSVLSKNLKSRLVFMVGRRERFQDVRDNLWNLMFDIGLKEIHSEIIEGFDDYGTLKYDYKIFGWK